ncbi:MAG: DUF5011 domain-containing protein [Clostridia bacterium]|nr:DUF5011 domain-containing protein [Clostridia bacterium]
MKKRIIKKAIALAVLLLVIGVVIKLLLLPSFKFSSNSVEIEAGKTFEAKTYIAKARNIDINKINISEKVDNKKPGEYKVTYSYKKIKKTLTVNVVDTVAPELTPENDFSVYAGEPVTADMLTAVKDATECELELDNHGQDLSVIGEYSVTVSATDLGGNTSKCEVKVTVKNPDITPPVISGVKNISIMVGDAFDAKKGVTVTDDYDKNPTLTVDDKSLNTKAAGKYTVIYTATDKAGNKASVRRTITVVNPVSDTSGNSSFDTRGVANQPYLVAVNRAMCTITVYKKDTNGNYTVPIKAMVCSVGRKGHQTPLGRYNTTNRYDWRLMVDGSYGRYAIRINGSIMFHSVCYFTKNEANLEYEEYNKLGSPASLGCIRLCLSDIKWIYDNCPTGFPTVIYDDPTSPGPLGKPSSIKIDINDVEKRGYDPTDWSPNSPWNK